ncbi:MAG TPA: DMT family transporter, partial [archaeon]|nr:DMT family transporter [archaeon]
MPEQATSEVKPKRAFWVVLASLLWATDAPFRKPITDQGMASTAIVFLEHVFSALVSLPLAWKQLPLVKRFDKADWLSLLFIGAGGSALGLVLFTQSFSYGNPTVTILIQKLQPIIAVVLAAAVLRERITRRFVVLAAVALLASYFLAFGDATYGPPLVELAQPGTWLAPFGSIGSAPTVAAGLALGAAILWGGSTVFGRRLASRYP